MNTADTKETELRVNGRFILASASPRRIELLNLLGLAFDVIPSGADESFLPDEKPRDHVRRLSVRKAETVAVSHPDAWVVGADTIVVIDTRVLGKPSSPAGAREMLQTLSGREHTVYTGFSIIKRNEEIVKTDVVSSAVMFREISADEMAWYLNSPEPYDKAGAYAVQGMSAFFIKEIRGSYTNVMGLPLCEFVDALKGLNAVTFPGG
ncbi:MAG: Maf family protein [Smithellaceae bacterium]|nr:Maf family protein [Smithellaceae bacterium]